VDPSRSGGVHGAAVAGHLDSGMGMVDPAAAGSGPAGSRPQGHPIRWQLERGLVQAPAARLPRHHPSRAAYVQQRH
jgi:hypothetical protein